MVDAFLGKWELVNTKNFDAYMIKLEVNVVLRNLAKLAKPTTTISKDGDVITIATDSTIKSTKIAFKFGEEFDEITADNRKTKTTVIMDEGKMVQTQRWDGKETTLVRELKDDDLILSCTMGDVECIRTYRKANS